LKLGTALKFCEW